MACPGFRPARIFSPCFHGLAGPDARLALADWCTNYFLGIEPPARWRLRKVPVAALSFSGRHHLWACLIAAVFGCGSLSLAAIFRKQWVLHERPDVSPCHHSAGAAGGGGARSVISTASGAIPFSGPAADLAAAGSPDDRSWHQYGPAGAGRISLAFDFHDARSRKARGIGFRMPSYI